MAPLCLNPVARSSSSLPSSFWSCFDGAAEQKPRADPRSSQELGGVVSVYVNSFLIVVELVFIWEKKLFTIFSMFIELQTDQNIWLCFVGFSGISTHFFSAPHLLPLHDETDLCCFHWCFFASLRSNTITAEWCGWFPLANKSRTQCRMLAKAYQTTTMDWTDGRGRCSSFNEWQVRWRHLTLRLVLWLVLGHRCVTHKASPTPRQSASHPGGNSPFHICVKAASSSPSIVSA